MSQIFWKQNSSLDDIARLFRCRTNTYHMIRSDFTKTNKVMAYTVLCCSMVLALCLLFLVEPDILKEEFWKSASVFMLPMAFIMICIGFFPLYKMKKITIKQNHIIFQNYLMPSKINDRHLNEYDYYQIVSEETENGFFESVWLIKDGRVKDRFSSYQYSNYAQLKSGLDLEYKGSLNLSPLKQFRCILGSKI